MSFTKVFARKHKEEKVSEFERMRSLWNIKQGEKKFDRVDPNLVSNDIYSVGVKARVIPPRTRHSRRKAH